MKVFRLLPISFFSLLLSASLLLWTAKSYGQSSEFNKAEVKAALLGHIVNNIEWPQNPPPDDLTIGVYRSQSSLQTIQILDQVKLKSRNVKLKLIEQLDTAEALDVLYIPAAFSSDISQLVILYRGNKTLLISENSPTLHNVMINLLEEPSKQGQGSHYRFQINRPNITFEQLQILPDLVLYGGTELDVALLYQQAEQALTSIREENSKMADKLAKSQQQLVAKEQELARLESDSKQLTAVLTQRQQDLLVKDREFSALSAKVNSVDENYQKSMQRVQQQEQELVRSKNEVAEQQTEIQLQLQVLQKLKSEISDNKSLLQQQSSQLVQSKMEVATQAKKIEQKDTIINVASAVVLFTLVGGSMIGYLLWRNYRTNKELAQTVDSLENTQSQLVESEKLASLGQLVAGVAHELNTPLGISLTAVSTMGSDAEKLAKLIDAGQLRKSDLTEHIEKSLQLDHLISHNLERCHKLIQSFKQVSSDQIIAESRTIYVRDYISEVMQTLSVLLTKEKVDWMITGDNPKMELDPGILSQIINNLTTNSIHHAFAQESDKAIKIVVVAGIKTVDIKFIDNGIGMSEQVRTNIFEPFFTTKRGKGGVGLGMNIVYNLVTAKLSGDIKLQSELGKGTEFVISLPHCA